MNRNNDAGYRNNSYTYTDTATYTDTGSRNWSWEWQGVDGGDPSNTGAIGPNLLGASLNCYIIRYKLHTYYTRNRGTIRRNK